MSGIPSGRLEDKISHHSVTLYTRGMSGASGRIATLSCDKASTPENLMFEVAGDVHRWI